VNEIEGAPRGNAYAPAEGCRRTQGGYDLPQATDHIPTSEKEKVKFFSEIMNHLKEQEKEEEEVLGKLDEQRPEETNTEDLEATKTVNVFFIRHGESTWNDATDHDLFNKMYLELKNGDVDEYRYLTDAHLSDRGIRESLAANQRILSNQDEPKDSQLIKQKKSDAKLFLADAKRCF
jgi:hypothetical protein